MWSVCILGIAYSVVVTRAAHIWDQNDTLGENISFQTFSDVYREFEKLRLQNMDIFKILQQQRLLNAQQAKTNNELREKLEDALKHHDSQDSLKAASNMTQLKRSNGRLTHCIV